ncbi:MAG TPA: hypothetical protein PK668_26920 [Myxococcota bacterium]|nr:hypothetical protein [Myxococcota bacterium]HRY97161.1 hypothetical protein [Myxococcota bacterium]HSA20702.1 hypothetical protein [Myxococcota bacterium]
MSRALALLALALGLAACQRPAPPGPAAGAAAPVDEPGLELDRLYALDYRGEIRLALDEPGHAWLETRVELTLTPRSGPVGRLDLGPGLYDQGVRPEVSPGGWEWSLRSVDSDRPVRLQATDWTLALVPDAPPGPGEPWRVELEYETPVGVLAQGLHASDLLPEPVTSAGALQAVLELGEKVLERFGKDAPTSSFAEGDYHVLIPPWPLVHDCAGRGAAEAFPPLECVSRHQLPAEIRVHLPAGWQAALPTAPRWETGPDQERVAVLDRLPAMLVLAPRLAWRELELGGRKVSLCAPEGRARDLEELGRLVALALPALEARLGPYPQGEPIVCLSPTPIDLWGLARGRLALVDVEAFSAPELAQGQQASLGQRLEGWIAGDAYFQSLREELVLHELAHHWWRSELPDRWERLLGEGAATLIAREAQLAGTSDERRRFFARASPWLDGAQIELAGVALPSRAAYLRRGPVPTGPAEALLPYLHGLLLLEGLYLDERGAVRWEALRALHAAAPAAARSPAAMLAAPTERARLAALLAEDAPLRPGQRVDPVEHALRCTEGMLDALEGDAALGPLLRPLKLTLPGLGELIRAQMAERLARAYGLETPDWGLAGEVLASAGIGRCAEPPADAARRAECLEELGGQGLGHLAGLMALGDPEVRRAADAMPEARTLLSRPRRPEELRAAAEATLARPVEVTDADAGRLVEGQTFGQARATVLYDRLAARWAARAALELIPLARFPGRGATSQTPETAPAF